MSFKATLFIVRLVTRPFKQRQFSNYNYSSSYYNNNNNKWRNNIPLFNVIPTLKTTRNRFELRVLQYSVAVSLGRSTRILHFNHNNNQSCIIKLNKSTSIKESKVKMPEAKPFERLPINVKPIHYNLTIKPDLKKCTFQGEVSIQIEVGFKHMPYFLIYLLL